MNGSLLKVYNTLNDFASANKMLVKMCAFKDWGNRLLDNDISCFSILNQDYDKILSDDFFQQRSCILLHDQEPMLYEAQKDKWKRWRFNTSPFDDRMIILHSERNSKDLERFCEELDAVPCHWFSNGALAVEWFQRMRWNLRFVIDQRRPRLHYKFSCLNRLISHQRCYRPVFSRILMDIVDHNQLRLSCSLTDPMDGTRAVDLGGIPNHHKHLFHNMNLSDPILINVDKEDIESGKIVNASNDPLNNYFEKVFCHIATETLFLDSTLHLTEKSLRAFVNKRPMILLGPPHSLSYLKSYGFRTFEDFWDEGYDKIMDPWKRLEAVVDLIKKLNDMSLNDMESMLDNMQPILEHNYRHFFYDFPDKILSELITNASDAISLSKAKEPNGWMIKRIKELSDARFNGIMNGIIVDEYDNRELYDGMKNNDKTKIDFNLARVLLLEMGFSKESSKDDVLARLNTILD